VSEEIARNNDVRRLLDCDSCLARTGRLCWMPMADRCRPIRSA